jgi:hypothetical protein
VVIDLIRAVTDIERNHQELGIPDFHKHSIVADAVPPVGSEPTS